MSGGAEPGDAADWLAAQAEAVIAETLELSRIPAPPRDEAQRADFVRQRLAGLSHVQLETDPTGNVLAVLNGGASGPALAISAHLDTVFGREVPHGARREGDRLTGPGVGDNAVAVAALLALARLVAADPVPPSVPLHLLFSVGEEGAGNLAGARAYVAGHDEALGAFIALEGHYLGRVATAAVGSRRWLVRLTGSGGHSWEDFGTHSAVHALARAVAAFSELGVPPNTSFNVGRIEGGRGPNVIAAEAAAWIDLRSTSESDLHDLEQRAHDCFRQEATRAGLSIHFESLGERPAGGIDPEAPLVRACRAALLRRGIPWYDRAASTDGNAALAAGIPAVAVGVTRGGGMHTREEWIDLTRLASGLGALRATVAGVSAVLARG